MKKENYIIITVCVILLLLCAIFAQYVHLVKKETYEDPIIKNTTDTNTSAVAANTADPASDNTQPVVEDEALIADARVLKSNRQTLLESVVSNLFFYGTYPELDPTLQNDIFKLYDAMNEAFKMYMSSFDVLCQNVEVRNDNIKRRLADSCDKYLLDLFAQKETSLYPGFDTSFSDVMNSATYPDNSLVLLDANYYLLTKNYYSPRAVKYTYDTNFGLIRLAFYNSGKITKPTYFMLAQPFAIEFEQLGIFNIAFDVDMGYNIMSYYNSEDDNIKRSLYLYPTPGKDKLNNKLNYMEDNFALPALAETLDVNPRYKQMKLYYLDFQKQGINTKEYHSMTIGIKPSSSGSLAMSYDGNRTSYVNHSQVSFTNKTLSISIDKTVYDELLGQVNAVMQSENTIDFNLFVTLSLNVMTITLMYKKKSFDHHVIIQRIPLLQSDLRTPYMKVVTFDPNLESASAYIHSNNNTFEIIPYIPNLMQLSQKHGYSFRV
jgi:hypothetical protein